MIATARLGQASLLALPLAVAPAIGHAAAPGPYAYDLEVTSEEDSIPPEVDRRFSRAFGLCQEAAQTTRDNSRCFSLEFNRQDGVLNRTWQATLRRWPQARRAGLIVAQRAWVARRDPFCREQADAYSGGTIMPVIYISCRVEVTIRRTMWLEKLR